MTGIFHSAVRPIDLESWYRLLRMCLEVIVRIIRALPHNPRSNFPGSAHRQRLVLGEFSRELLQPHSGQAVVGHSSGADDRIVRSRLGQPLQPDKLKGRPRRQTSPQEGRVVSKGGVKHAIKPRHDATYVRGRCRRTTARASA